MGTLVHIPSGRRLSLRSVHVVGRAPSCDLNIPAREVSAQHAALRWNGEHWVVRDLGSRNGTWIDGSRLGLGEEAHVPPTSGLGFGTPIVAFRLEEGGPPVASAIDLDSGETVLVENGLLFLPDEEQPSACVHSTKGGEWVCEAEGIDVAVQDGDVVDAGGRTWRLHLPEPVFATLTAPAAQLRIGRVTLRFLVSRDEEDVRVLLLDEHGERDLGSRAHNYLLLTLARRRLRDRDRPDLPDTERGWVYSDELTQMLGIEPNVIYLHTCRARKAFAKAGLADAFDVIERRQGSGQVRLGVEDIEIFGT